MRLSRVCIFGPKVSVGAISLCSKIPVSLEEGIEVENEVRAIDLFVKSLDLGKMGFKVCFPECGRSAYHPLV